jgi:hypothetical protein
MVNKQTPYGKELAFRKGRLKGQSQLFTDIPQAATEQLALPFRSSQYMKSARNNNNNNNNNSIPHYLCAVSTATRPITDTAQCIYR